MQTHDPYKRKVIGRFHTVENNVTMDTDWNNCRHKSRNASSHHKLEVSRNGFSPRSSRGSEALLRPDFGPVILILFGLLAFRTLEAYISVVLTTNFIVICYSSR